MMQIITLQLNIKKINIIRKVSSAYTCHEVSYFNYILSEI